MKFRVSRREFLSGLAMVTASTALPSIPGYASLDPPLYPLQFPLQCVNAQDRFGRKLSDPTHR